MGRYTLFAYVDGFDLDGVAAELDARLEQFVRGRSWVTVATVVNQRRLEDASLRNGDLPDWDLGLNIELPDVGEERPGWFGDLEETLGFLAQLHSRTGRDFVLGVYDSQNGITEDLFSIDGPTPNVEEFRRILGVRDVSSRGHR
jgi:hypothetical protein